MLPIRGFMLDTCTINRIHDQEVGAHELTFRGRIYVTDIQMQEIAHTQEPGRLRDALIAESTRAYGLTLVTSDRRLAKMARSFGIPVEAIQ